MLTHFTYDETVPIDALKKEEKERAEYLNTKGALEGLTQQEFDELKKLYDKGVGILEGRSE